MKKTKSALVTEHLKHILTAEQLVDASVSANCSAFMKKVTALRELPMIG